MKNVLNLMIIKILNKIRIIFFKIRYQIKLKKYFRSFTSYEENENFCNNINEGNYLNNELNTYRLDIFNANLKNICINYQPSFDFLNESLRFHRDKYKYFPKILDFGGGFGDGFLYLRTTYDSENIDYSIVETNKVVDLSKKIEFENKTNQKIIFFNSLDDALSGRTYDIIFISGVLQFLKNPYEILNKINNSNIKFISLTRNSFSDKEKFIPQFSHLFDNGSGNISKNIKDRIIVYPHTTIIENKVISNLNNYKIRVSKKTSEPTVYKNTYSKDLLFEIHNS